MQYCDDVRQEIGNKLSLMGCYSNDLVVQTMPTILPKLCAVIHIIIPRDEPFSKLTIRAVLNEDTTLAELEIPDEVLSKSQAAIRDDGDARGVLINAIMTFTPLPVAEEGNLKVFAEGDDKTLVGNTLRLRQGAHPDFLTDSTNSLSITHD